jgi:hypothetical protein
MQVLRNGNNRVTHERRKEDRIVNTTLIIRTDLPSHDDDRKAFEEITSI